MKTTNVPGLSICEDVLSEEMETEIIKWLDTREWSTVLPRRTQHYGYTYNYGGGNVSHADKFEGWITHLSDFLAENNIMKNANQCIVNEYSFFAF